jgi:hypothetical protein
MLLPRAALGLQSSYLCLPSSWDHKCVTSHPVCFSDRVLLTSIQAGLRPSDSYLCLLSSWLDVVFISIYLTEREYSSFSAYKSYIFNFPCSLSFFV